MIDRTASVAGAVAAAQGKIEKLLCAGYRHLQGQPLAKAGGNGGGKGAARAVVVDGFYLGLRQVFGSLSLHAQAVGDNHIAFHMTALDKNGPCAHLQQFFTGRRRVVKIINGHVGEHFRFGPVGRQQIAAGQDFLYKCFYRVFLQKNAAALAYGNRVYHKRKVALAQYGGNGLDDGG